MELGKKKVNKNRLCSKNCGIDVDFVHHLGRQCTPEEKLKGNICGVPPQSGFVEPKSSIRKVDETGWWDLGSHPEDNL